MHRVLATGTVVLALLVSATACGTSMNVGGSSGTSQDNASSSASASASASASSSGGCDHNVDWPQLSQDNQKMVSALSTGEEAEAKSTAVDIFAGDASSSAGVTENLTQKAQLIMLATDLQTLAQDYNTLVTSNIPPTSMTADQAKIDTDWLPLATCAAS